MTAETPASTPETTPEPTPAPDSIASASPVGSKAVIGMTFKAIQAVKTALQKRGTPEAAVRVGIKGGGCSGYSYVIEFDDNPPRDRDRVFEFDGVKVFVDKKSLIYLAGSTLDYEKTMMKQGFKFVNPNEATRCGCGTSFTVK